MLFMLEKKNQNLVEILEIMLKKNDWIVANDIALQTNLSLRSVNNYLKFLKESFPCLKLESSMTLGYRATNLSSDRFRAIQRKVFNESLSVQIISNVFFNPSITIDDCMKLLNVSRTTMYRRIEEINNKLSSYDVQIRLKKNKCCLVSSDEVKLRLILSIFFIESDNYKEDSFQEYQKLIIERLASIFSDVNDFTDFYKKDFYMLYYYVSIMREKQSFNFQHEMTYQLTKKDNEFIPKEEMLLRIDSSIKYIEDYKHVHKIKDVNNLLEEIKELVCSILSFMSVNPDNHVIQNLARFLLDIYLVDVYIGINDFLIFRMFHFFTDSFNREYPKLYETIQINFEEYLAKTGVNLLNIASYSVAAVVLLIPEVMEYT